MHPSCPKNHHKQYPSSHHEISLLFLHLFVPRQQVSVFYLRRITCSKYFDTNNNYFTSILVASASFTLHIIYSQTDITSLLRVTQLLTEVFCVLRTTEAKRALKGVPGKSSERLTYMCSFLCGSDKCVEKRGQKKYPGTEYNIMVECMTNHAECWDGIQF